MSTQTLHSLDSGSTHDEHINFPQDGQVVIAGLPQRLHMPNMVMARVLRPPSGLKHATQGATRSHSSASTTPRPFAPSAT